MRMWEIREGDNSSFENKKGNRMHSMRSYRDSEYDEAYECGYEDGYRDAMKEAKSYYGERRMR